MSNFIEYNGLCAFHPGYYISEFIDEVGYSYKDFATEADIPVATVNMLISGEIALSKDIAYKISAVVGSSVDVWLNLQAAYDKKISQIKSQKKYTKIKFLCGLKRERKALYHKLSARKLKGKTCLK